MKASPRFSKGDIISWEDRWTNGTDPVHERQYMLVTDISTGPDPKYLGINLRTWDTEDWAGVYYVDTNKTLEWY